MTYPTPKRRAGFTLIELLVVITIIAMLGTMSVVVSRAAIESAKRSRTEMTIAKIDSVINSIYEQYQNKRVDLTPYLVKEYDGINNYWIYKIDSLGSADQLCLNNPLWSYQVGKIASPADNHKIVPQLWRLHLLRDTIRIEMPCWVGDVATPSLPSGVLDDRPTTGLVDTYKQALSIAVGMTDKQYPITDLLPLTASWGQPEHAKFNAYLLYLVVTNGMPESREQFTSKDIGIDPVTGLSYFIDGWGNPIHWLRWAPGVGEVRTTYLDADGVIQLTAIAQLGTNLGIIGNPDSDRQYVGNLSAPNPGSQSDDDPTDPLEIDLSLGADLPSWLLVPYIFSDGPDGASGLDPGYVVYMPVKPPPDDEKDPDFPVLMDQTTSLYRMVNTYPFLFNPTALENTNLSAGSLNGTGEHLDNIHNHKVRR